MTDKIKKFCYDEGITVNISNYKDEIDKEKKIPVSWTILFS